MQFRHATARDSQAIAALHAESWRRHYRGAYSDQFLDGDVCEDRRAVWSARLADPAPEDDTVVAEEGGTIMGFVHTILDDDPNFGALVDNLHVTHGLQRSGVGTALMSHAAAAVLDRGRIRALYLWVLEQNTAAQAFYAARGGQPAGRKVSEPPGGGSITAIRYAWPDPEMLRQTPRRA